MAMGDPMKPTLTDEERAAGWRLVRLGTGPWQKIPPGTKLAADYGREHRARVKDIRAKISEVQAMTDSDQETIDDALSAISRGADYEITPDGIVTVRSVLIKSNTKGTIVFKAIIRRHPGETA